VSLNEKTSASEAETQARQRLRVFGIESRLLVFDPDGLVSEVDEVWSIRRLMCAGHACLYLMRVCSPS